MACHIEPTRRGVQVTRVACILLMWPLLNRVGYGLTWQEAIILAWAGIRGPVGLALSLFVLLNQVRTCVAGLHATKTSFTQILLHLCTSIYVS